MPRSPQKTTLSSTSQELSNDKKDAITVAATQDITASLNKIYSTVKDIHDGLFIKTLRQISLGLGVGIGIIIAPFVLALIVFALALFCGGGAAMFGS